MKQFTVWYAGHVIRDCAYGASAAAVKKQWKAGTSGTVVVVPSDATPEQNEATRAASSVISN